MKVNLGLAMALLAALVFSVPPAAPTVGVQEVTLSCNDGTNLGLTLNPDAVTALTSAVSAMTLYPAGDPALACNVAQSTSVSGAPESSMSSSGGNPQHDYAVGGGQAKVLECGQTQDFEENFALSAHVDADGMPTDASGTFNLTVSAKPANAVTCVSEDFPAQLRSKIECLTVSGNIARFRAAVTKATGLYTNPYATPGAKIYGAVLDNGTPTPPLLTDLLNYSGRPPTSSDPCSDVNPTRPIEHGNISVHDG